MKTYRLLVVAIVAAAVVIIVVASREDVQRVLWPTPGSTAQSAATRWRAPGLLGGAAAVVAWVSFTGLIALRTFLRLHAAGKRRVLIGIALSVGVLLIIDRGSLALWRYRIGHYCRRLQTSATVDRLWDRGDGLVPYLEVGLQGPKPAWVTVDGHGGLHFAYTPPWLAWSRYLPYLNPKRTVNQASDVFPYNDIYFVNIETVDGRTKRDLPHAKVSLEHGCPF